MVREKPDYRSFPKVPLDRRAWAFLIDFVAVWLVSSVVGIAALHWLLFILAWLGLRVVLPDKNQGQSLGQWALDLKVIDAQFNRIPGLLPLAKREGIMAVAALLAMVGLNINFRNPISMLLLVSPLLADCGVAIADERLAQAFHDRIAQTIVIPTSRGFSLDIRVKKLIAQFKQNMR